jgi:peptidoglycan/LPS O-acetylase OafA/YrhL
VTATSPDAVEPGADVPAVDELDAGPTHLGPAVPAPEASPSAAAGRVHFPCFEGLRALAAVMVVVHHASSLAGDARSPGFVHRTASVMDSGVAVFFVISGFLIYRPYVAAQLAGRKPLRPRAFFWRRLLRLVPAYWVALTFFWWLGNFDLGRDWWRYYLFLQIYSSRTTLGGLVQAWSLCTEVTFYLLVPLVAGALVWAVGRGRRSPRAVAGAQLAMCGLLYASGFVARAVISNRNPRWRGLSFQWLPTNVDLFAVGMAIAVVSALAATDHELRARLDRLAKHGEIWWAAAILLFAWYAARVGPASFMEGYRGWFWQQRQLLLGVMTALLLVPVVFGPQRQGIVRRVLRCRPIVWVGTVSYGLYLWHFDWMKRAVPNTNGFTGEVIWPGWIHAADGRAPFVTLLAIGLGAGCLFAALSWTLLERPIERFKSLVH